MFKQILVSIIWLLASLCMQKIYQPSSMQELYQIIYNLQKMCQYKTGISLAIARSLPNKTGTDIAIAWGMPKVIGTGFANAEGMPNKIGTVYANTIFMPNLN